MYKRQGKELTIPLVASDPAMDIDEFIAYVARPGYRTVRVPALGREWRLRLLSEPGRVTYGRTADRLVSLSLRFADDFPMREDTYPAAQGGGVLIPGSSYSLDGVPLDTYGVMVEEGRDSVLRSAAVRQNLTRRFSTMDGVLYDADTVVFEGKDVTFKCCLVTDTIERFWRCYTAFFNDLIRPGERSLGYAGTGRSYGCYYKSTSGWTLAGLSGRVVVEFSLTLAFTAFATEDDFLVSTEDDALVDLSLNRAAAPTGYIAGLDAGASSGTGGTEVRRRKITEMPEAGALDDIVLMGVDGTTNRNVRFPYSRIAQGGTGNIIVLPYDSYLSLGDRREDTLYACLDVAEGRITRAFIGGYPFLCSPGEAVTGGFPFEFDFLLDYI